VYRLSRDAVRSFSKLVETLTLVRVTYAHVWARVAGWVGEIDHYLYVYRVSRDAVRSFSKLLETLTLVRVTYAHVWARVAEWVGEEEKHVLLLCLSVIFINV
jgi:hypothetical protein